MQQMSDEELRRWLGKRGPLPLRSEARFDRARFRRLQTEHAERQSSRLSALWWITGIAVVALLSISIPGLLASHGVGGRRAHVATPTVKLPTPVVNLGLAESLGGFAYTNSRGLWMTTPHGKLIRVTSDRSVSYPAWSGDGEYLSYETSGQDGAHPMWHVYNRGTHKEILTLPGAAEAVWSPNLNQLAVVTPRGLQVESFTGSGFATDTLYKGQVSTSVIWSPQGKNLAFVTTSGSGLGRRDVVQKVAWQGGGWGGRARLFSLRGQGIQLASFLGTGGDILYWPDPEFSASVMADGAMLTLWRGKKSQRTLSTMLTYQDYLSVKPSYARNTDPQTAFMAGGNRDISGLKHVVLMNGGRAKELPVPRGMEAIEPAEDPASGRVALVLARNGINASSSTNSQAYRSWVKTRQLAISSHGKLAVWTKAGNGVTDPFWAPGGQGVLYLQDNWLWLIKSQHATPQPVLGPLPSTGGYYGEILRSSELSVVPNPVAVTLKAK